MDLWVNPHKKQPDKQDREGRPRKHERFNSRAGSTDRLNLTGSGTAGDARYMATVLRDSAASAAESRVCSP